MRACLRYNSISVFTVCVNSPPFPRLHLYLTCLLYSLFSILYSLRAELGVVHGDVKPENVLSTNWHFVVLTDFAPYKPTVIPNDDPTEFQYYFDAAGNRACYLAPERFAPQDSIISDTSAKTKPAGMTPDNINSSTGKANQAHTRNRNDPLTPAMDVFSLACTVAEVMLDCKCPLLDLPGMVQYVSLGASGLPTFERLDDENSPCRTLLSRIEDPLLRNVIAHMTQLNPAKRLTIRDYRCILEGTMPYPGTLVENGTDRSHSHSRGQPIFPAYFGSSLLPLYMALHWTGVTPDRRLSMICRSYGSLLEKMTGSGDEAGQLLICKALDSVPYVKPFKLMPNGSDSMRMQQAEARDITVSYTDVSDDRKRSIREEYMKAALHRKSKTTSGVSINEPLDAGSDGGYVQRLQSDFSHPRAESGAGPDGVPGSGANRWTSSGLPSVGSQATDELARRCRDFLDSVADEIDTEKEAQSGSSNNMELQEEALALEAAASALSTLFISSKKNVGGDMFLCVERAALGQLICSPAALPRETVPGMEVLVSLLGTIFRHFRFPQSKVSLILLLTRVGPLCDDEVILQRIVPILTVCLDDEHNAHIRAIALRAMTKLLCYVRTLQSNEADIFPLCLLPSLKRLVRDPDVAVRVAFAECLGRLAETSKRFLELAHLGSQRATALLQYPPEGVSLKSTKSNSSGASAKEPLPPPLISTPTTSTSSADLMPPNPPQLSDKGASNASVSSNASGNGFTTVAVEFPYAIKLKELHDNVAQWIKALSDESQGEQRKGSGLSSNSSHIKRMLLNDIMRVCVFFGPDETVSQLLPHLLTFFSDQDWELRHAFWSNIASVCACVGPILTEAYILPGLDNALVDVEERVVVAALHFLKSLCELQLATQKCIVGYVASKSAALLLGPSTPVREAAAQFVAAASVGMGAVDTVVLLLPKLRKLFRFDVVTCTEITADSLLVLLASPVQRIDYRRALIQRQRRYLENSAMMNSDLIVSYSSTVEGVDDEPDAETALKLEMMSEYIDQAAKELASKTMQWRHALTGGINSGSFSASLRRSLSLKQTTSPGSLDSILSITTTHSLSQSLQTLMVPHQKYGAGYFYSLTEEQRALAGRVLDMRNPASICALYGISNSQYDTVRALNGAGPASSGPLAALDTGLGLSSDALAAESQFAVNGNGSRNQIPNVNNTYRAIEYGKHIRALGIPPLPPDVGALVQPTLGDDRKPRYYNGYTDVLDLSSNAEMLSLQGKAPWRPRENCLVCSLLEHTQAVNRLAVCPDQSFFASASSDGTVKIWQLSGLDKYALPSSSLTYRGHRSPVTDVTVIENSHSMASASRNGAVHVWRVDVEARPVDDQAAHASGPLKMAGLGLLKQIDTDEGAVIGLSHFNSEAASVLLYATQSGGLHGWDLRSSNECMYFRVGPELGTSTALAVAPDRSWAVIGTSRGFIALWDLRYNLMCRLWQHSSASPIWKLACSKSLMGANPQNSASVGGFTNASSPALADTEGAYLFVAAGDGETSVFGLPEAGECLKCFRNVPLSDSTNPLLPLPVLTEIALPRHPGGVVSAAYELSNAAKMYSYGCDNSVAEQSCIRGIVGRTPVHLITAGSDKSIRYWDFKSPAKCFVVSGLEAGQPKATFEAPAGEGLAGRLFVCYDSAMPSIDVSLPVHLPLRGDRGPLAPNPGFRSAILDIKSIDLPIRGLLACSKDGVIKLWK